MQTEFPANSTENTVQKEWHDISLDVSSGTIDPSWLFNDEENQEEFRMISEQALEIFQQQVPAVQFNHLSHFFPHLFNDNGECILQENFREELDVLLRHNPHFLSCNTHVHSGCTLGMENYHKACATFGVEPIKNHCYKTIYSLNDIIRSEWQRGYTMKKEDSMYFFPSDLAMHVCAYNFYMEQIALSVDPLTSKYHCYAHVSTRYLLDTAFQKYSTVRNSQPETQVYINDDTITKWNQHDRHCSIQMKESIGNALATAQSKPYKITIMGFKDIIPAKLAEQKNQIVDSMIQKDLCQNSILFVDCSKNQSFETLKSYFTTTTFNFLIIWNVHLLGMFLLEELMQYISCQHDEKLPFVIFMYDMDFQSDVAQYLSKLNKDVVYFVEASLFMKKTNNKIFGTDPRFYTPEFQPAYGIQNECYYQKNYPVPEVAISDIHTTLHNPVSWADTTELNNMIAHYSAICKQNIWAVSFIVSSLSEKEKVLPLIMKHRFSDGQNAYTDLGIGSTLYEGWKCSYVKDIAASPQQTVRIIEDEDNPQNLTIQLRSYDGMFSQTNDTSEIINAECDVLERVRRKQQCVIYYSEEDVTRNIFYKLCSLATHNIIIICPRQNLLLT